MSNRYAFLALLMFLAGSPASAAVADAPVVFDGATLFTLRVPLGPFSAEQRAQTLAGRLERLAELPEADNGITVGRGETSSEILAGDTVLMVVTDADAAAEQRNRDELATFRAQTVGSALAAARQARSSERLMHASIHAGLATLAAIVFILMVRAGRTYLARRIEDWRNAGRLALRLQNAELVSGERMAQALRRIIRAGGFLLWLLALYFYALAVFSFFPATRQYASLLLNALLVPFLPAWHAFVDYLPNIGVIVAVVAFATLLMRLVHFVFAALGDGSVRFKGFHPDWSDTTYKIARFLIVVFAAVVAFPYLPGAGSPAFQGISIFLGVLFSFGSGSAISNIIAGVVLTYTRAFAIGDRVRINDTEGDVVAKTLIATHIRSIKNVVITVPNSIMLGNHMINYSSEAAGRGLVLHTTVTIGYDVPWRKVHEVLLGAARDTQMVLQDPSPYVYQLSLDDFYVSYQLNAVTRDAQRQAAIYSELNQHIQDRFHAAGVEILSPHYTALRDGNALVMPAASLPANYAPPAFRVRAVD